ncbi:MAG: M23 family metallopeptidase [Candidatus Acidiferrales bacterium]
MLSAILGILLLTVLALVAGGCGGSSRSSEAAETSVTPVAQTLTPLLLSVSQAPVPFFASDGHVHLTYELWLTNFSSAPAEIENVQISDNGNLLQTLDAVGVAERLQPAGFRVSSGIMAASTQSLLFIDVILPDGVSVPDHLSHTVEAHIDAAPPGNQDVTATLDGTPVNHRPVLVIGPPLRGNNYVSADSCCDSARHRRAALPVNGAVWLAQRYAVDWEELNDQNRIYAGPKAALSSYTIWGKPVLAVADGRVVTAINNEPDQPPGSFPSGLSVDQADGNAVILDLGHRNYAVYAHMQQGSVRVTVGQRVTRGEVIGLVGNSGNTLAPHLHFQLMDAPQSLASNGLPYEIDSYQITAISPGTAAFDEAEANGTPLAVTPVSPPRQVTAALPLDQLIISFGP